MKLQVRISLLFVTTLLFSQTFTWAQISLPKVFGDSMVLQRGINIPVWGNSTPGALIIAKLGNRQVTAKANKEGKWQLKFPVFKAGGPYELQIVESGKPNSRISLKGILIGDVWVASGQSNMEWQVQQEKDASKEIATADFPNIRFLVVKQDKQLKPQPDIRGGKWEICDSSNVKEWSAVAYHFARKIHKDENIPIGIIQSTWGGTPVEAWTSRDMLLTSPITRSKTLSNDTLRFDQVNFLTDSLNWVHIWDIVYNPKNNADKIIPATEYSEADWTTVEMPNVIKDLGIGYYEGMVWLRKKVTLPDSLGQNDLTINLGHPEMNYSLYFNGQEICKNIWYSNATHTYTIPKRLVQHGVNTIALRIAMLWGGGGLNLPAEDIYITNGSSKISLAGKWLYKKDLEPAFPKILNYQYYPTVLFNGMINPLIPYGIKGFIWYQGEANSADAYNYRKLFPMLISDWRNRWKQGNLPFLFVQLANFMKTKPLPSESEWAELREAQTLSLSQPNTGMACTIDIGEANDIHPKNKQEVGRRLALIANKLVYKKEVIESGPVYKSSRKTGNRIHIIFEHIGSGLSTKEGMDIKGFAIAGKDKQFYWANAIIEGNEAVVYSDKVAEPVAVRYAWADNPDCNLINSEGLPAVPFRTDEWKGITQFLQTKQIAKLESPDKSILLNVFLSPKGEIRYQIQKSGISVIEPSDLGVMMKGYEFAQGMKLLTVSKPERIIDNYQTRNAKKSNIQYQANQLVLSFINDQAKKMDLIFRLSNDGVAFRYFFPWIKNSETIIKENSSFTFDKNARAWLQPMSEAKTGWQQCHPSYEEHYLQNISVGTVSPLKSGWVYPALFQTNDIWVLITEAALDGTYCGT